jgi:hypothetical protein
MILVCVNPDCKSTFQDHEYGRARRVMNKRPPTGNNNQPRYRCTVCGTTRTE